MSTREKLLILAEEAVRARGFGATSYGELARAAGIRKASVHHHFPAKADLGRALVERHAQRLGEELAAISSGARTGADVLRALAAAFRAPLAESESLSLLTVLAAERASLPQPMQEALRDAVRRLAGCLEDAFRRGRQDRSIAVPGEPAVEALAALAQLQGAQLVAHAERDPGAFDSAIAPLLARTTRH